MHRHAIFISHWFLILFKKPQKVKSDRKETGTCIEFLIEKVNVKKYIDIELIKKGSYLIPNTVGRVIPKPENRAK